MAKIVQISEDQYLDSDGRVWIASDDGWAEVRKRRGKT